MICHGHIQPAEPTDLIVVHAGMEKCTPGHAFGPAVRDYYLFHFIHSGSGFFQHSEKRYPLKAGQGFMIFPDQVTYYQADQADPWHYTWIAFSGTRAAIYVRQAGFSLQAPILADPLPTDGSEQLSSAACFFQIGRSLHLQQGREQRLLGLLYVFLANLIATNPQLQPNDEQLQNKDRYVRQARDYMEMNYNRKIVIAELAAHIGLDRSYFGQLFRSRTGQTPQQYLLRLRLAKACQLMEQSDLPVGTIARSVGYEDPLLFSRMFRRMMGCSPSEHRLRVNLIYKKNGGYTR